MRFQDFFCNCKQLLVDFSAILPRLLLTTRLFCSFLQTDSQLLVSCYQLGKRPPVKLCTFQAMLLHCVSQGLPKDYCLTPWFPWFAA